jgi:hypothetical protein
MGLWDRLVGRGVAEVIEWAEPAAQDALAVLHTGLRLRAGSALLVRPGQACVVSSGGVADVIGPDRYELTPAKLPKLAAAKVIRGAGAAFKADVSFVSVAPHSNVPWATVASVVARDANNDPVPAKAGGEISFVVTDPVLFVREVVAPGVAPEVTRHEVAALATNYFGEIFRTGGLEEADLLGPTGRLGQVAGEQLATSLLGVGITLTRFTVKNVIVAPELRRANGPVTEGGGDGYRAELPAPLFPDAAAAPTESGLPALPAGLADILEPPLPRNTGPKSVRLPIVHDAPEGIFASRKPATGPQSDRLLLGGTPATETPNGAGSENLFDLPAAPGPSIHKIDRPLAPAERPPGPPPLPATLEFHVGINGTPVGPFDLIVLAARVRDGSLGRKSLVWRPGMDGWCAAEHVTELAPLFAGPPELPPEG